MTTPDHQGTLLVEMLRTQEALKTEFQAIRTLLEKHDSELCAVRERIAQLAGPSAAGPAGAVTPIALPLGLVPQGLDDGSAREVSRSIEQEIRRAFYPERTPYLLDAPYVRVRRLHEVDLSRHALAILSTLAWEHSDVFYATEAASAVELQLHSLRGPTSATHWQRGQVPTQRQHLTCDIESWPDALDAVDTLWIPDPSLAALVLRCKGLPERICARVRQQWIVSIDTESWDEDEARELIHRAGFTEIRRLAHDASAAYTTRRHESRGFVVIDQGDPAEGFTPTRHLIASKFPSASFRIVPPSQFDRSDARGQHD